MTKKILLNLSDEENDSLSEMLKNADITITDNDEDNLDLVVITHEEYQRLQNRISELSDDKNYIPRELQYPIVIIKCYTDFLLGRMVGELTEQQETFLEKIKLYANQMLSMLNDLRVYAKLDGRMFVDCSPFAVKPMIEEMVRPFVPRLKDKNQTVNMIVAADLPYALGDEVRFGQVLTNLVSNAHKYSAEGDLITIEAKVSDDHIQISVVDNGIGIPEDELPLIFKQTYSRGNRAQVENQAGAVGLGLLITHHFVTRMNGEIWVESELGKGSTFHFTIPIAKDDAPSK